MGIIQTKELLGGPFPSTKVVSTVNGFPKGDKALTADFLAYMFATFMKSGILKDSGGDFVIEPYRGLKVMVHSGDAWIKGHLIKCDFSSTYDLEPGYCYTFVLRVDLQSGGAYLVIYDDEDDDYLPIRTASIYDLVLGYVDLSDEDEDLDEIGEEHITDTRGDANLCGYAATRI